MINIIKSLVYLLIFLFPLGFLVRFTPVPNVHILPQDVVVFLLSVAVFYYNSNNKVKNELRLFASLQGLFVAVGVISLFINSLIYRDINVPIALLYAVRYVMYLSLLFVGPFFENSKRVVSVLFMSFGVFLAAGFVQYVKFNDLKPLFNLGWDDHLYRLFSTVLDPNFAGVLYVIILILLARFVYANVLQKSYMPLVLSFFSLLAIYLSYSRTALVALISSVGVILIGLKQFKIALFSSAIFFVILFAVSDVTVEGLNPFRTRSSANRLLSMNEALGIISKSQYFGVGFNSYRYAQIRYGMRNEEGSLKSNSDAGTDNSFLFVLATSGVIGFLLFAASYFFLLKKLLIEERNIFFFGLIISLFSAGMFLNVLFYTPILTILFLSLALRKKFG